MAQYPPSISFYTFDPDEDDPFNSPSLVGVEESIECMVRVCKIIRVESVSLGSLFHMV